MKKGIGMLALVMCFASGCVFGQLTTDKEQKLPLADDIASIELSGHNGSVTWIDIGEDEERYVLVRREVRGSSRIAIEEHLERVKIADKSVGTKAHFEVDEPRRPSGVTSSGIRFTIYAPASAIEDLRVTTSNGSISVQQFHGHLDLRTSNGSVDIQAGQGTLAVRTSNGSIDLFDVTLIGSSTVKTSNGRIAGGVTLASKDRFTFETSNGSIQLELAGDLGGTFDVSTSNGSIAVRLPGLNYDDRKPDVLGDGTPYLTAHTTNGNVTIKEQN